MPPPTLLDIRPGEGGRVGGMFALLGLIIATSYVLKPVRSALFLTQFGSERLPYVYLAVALVLGVAAAAFSRLTRDTDLPRLFQNVALLFAASLAGFWGLTVVEWPWTGFAFYVWVSVFTALMPSLFWLLANYLFYSNEGRRLFPVVMAGGLLGSILGGAATSLLVPFVGTAGLLLAAAVLLVGIGLLVRWNAGRERERMEERRSDLSRREKERAFAEEASPLRTLGRSRYLSMVAALIAVGSLASTLVDFQFNTVVDRTYESRDDLTSFFGVFFAVINVLAFLLQLLVTGRLLGRFGVGAGLLMLPGALLLSSASFFLFPVLATALAIKTSDDGLSNSVHRASVEVLYLPIPLTVKNRIKAWLDMFIERVSRGLAGLTILATSALSVSVDELSLVVLALVIPWILLAVALQREYVRTFRDSIARRDITDFTSALRDPASLSVLHNVLSGQDERETLYALELLSGTDAEEILDDVARLASHGSPAIRTAALRLLRSSSAEPPLGDFAERARDPDAAAAAEALALWLRVEPEEARTALEAIVSANDPGRLGAVLECLEESGEPLAPETAQRIVAANHASSDPARRRLAARAAGFLPDAGESVPVLVELVGDPDLAVARTAISSAGRVGGEAALEALVAQLRRRPLRVAARRAIASFGEDALDELERRLRDSATDFDLKLALPVAIAEIHKPRSLALLLDFLPQEDQRLHYQGIKALAKLRAADGSLKFPRSAVEALLETERGKLVTLARQLAAVRGRKPAGDSHRLLALVLEERLEFTRERIFRLLGLIYPQDEILGVWSRLTNGRPSERAQALEFLSSSLSAAHRESLYPLLEPPSWNEVAERARALTNVETPGFEEALRQLATSSDAWVAACAVTVVGDLPLPSLASTLALLREHPNEAVREAAAKSLASIAELRPSGA